MSKAKRGMMSSKSARDDVIIFFKSITERRLTDAERALNTVKEKRFGNSEFKAGYVNALEGILLSSRSGDSRDFINKAPFDALPIERQSKEFVAFVKEGIHTPFDVGYFSAWSDFMHYLLNVEKGG